MTDLCEREIYKELEFFQMARSRLLYPNIFDVLAKEKPDLKRLYTPTCQIELSNKFYELAQQLEYNQNIDKAIELYQKSVELGNTDAMVALANIYIDEEKSDKYKEALQLLRTAISKGSVAAKTALAYCYFDGIDDLLPENLEEAIKLFEISAKSGDTKAILELCFIYSEDDDDIPEIKELREKLEKQYEDSTITDDILKETALEFFNIYITHSEIKENFQKALKYKLLQLNLIKSKQQKSSMYINR